MKKRRPAYNKSQLADFFGLARGTVQSRIRSARLVGEDRGKEGIFYNIDEVGPILFKKPVKAGKRQPPIPAASPKLLQEMKARIDGLERELHLMKLKIEGHT